MALANDSDQDWKCLGERNPYFGVLADPKFLAANLTDDSLREFFDSGERHVEHVYAVIRSAIRPDFQPNRILDYGCGVGRLVIPFAQRSGTAIGVDISPAMLARAQENCKKYNAISARLIHVDDLDSLAPASFDLVHSFIVFQHIPVARGEVILRKLIALITEGGVGAIHLTYSNTRSALWRSVRALRTHLNLVHGWLNLFQRRPFSAPLMQMNNYSLNHIFDILVDAGCSRLHVEFLAHGGFHGAMLYFEKSSGTHGRTGLSGDHLSP